MKQLWSREQCCLTCANEIELQASPSMVNIVATSLSSVYSVPSELSKVILLTSRNEIPLYSGGGDHKGSASLKIISCKSFEVLSSSLPAPKMV